MQLFAGQHTSLRGLKVQSMRDPNFGHLEAEYKKPPVSLPGLALIGVGLLMCNVHQASMMLKASGGVLLLMGLALCLTVLSFRFRIYAQGIVVSTIFGRREFPFDAQMGIMTRLLGDRLHFYFRHLDVYAHVHGIKDEQGAFRRLQRIEDKKIFPAVIGAYEKGKLVDFGELRLKGQVIHFGNQSLRIEQLKQAELKSYTQTKIWFGATPISIYVAWGPYSKTDFRMYDSNGRKVLQTEVGGLYNFNIFLSLLKSKYIKIVGL